MPRLEDIAVVARTDTLTGNAQAVLREVSACLETLAASGEGASIDVRGLPLSESDRDWLRERLGRGEVDISLDAGGESRLHETAFPGVWWVEHRNEEGARVSEFIEIRRVPEIVAAHPDDVLSGSERLKTLIHGLD